MRYSANVHLDDILVFCKSLEEHVGHLSKVFKLLRKNRLFAKLSKCEFAQESVQFLGHHISSNGVEMEREKVQSILDWPDPRNKADVQSFLGLVNYYRRFLYNLADVARPLTLLTGNAPFKWESEEKQAFSHMKRLVTSADVLRSFDPTLPIFIGTDASGKAIGAVLEQEEHGSRRPVGFFSRTLNIHEQRYHIRERELLSIVASLVHWRAYLHGQRFTVFNDHESLKYLHSQDKLSDRQVRWLNVLDQYDFTFVAVRGKTHIGADALSRQGHEAPSTEESDQLLLNRVLQSKSPYALRSISSIVSSNHVEELKQGYSSDPEFRDIYQEPVDPFVLKAGLLYFEGKLCVPKSSWRNKLLQDHHEVPCKGHMGYEKTVASLSASFYWKDLKSDVKSFVRTCPDCQRNKASTQKPIGFLQPLQPETARWTSITMDLIPDLPVTSRGHDAVYVVVDRMSKMIRIIPLQKNRTAESVAHKFYENVYRHHGFPSEIISDRDSIFMSKFWETLFKRVQVTLKPSSSYHPETDGQTERMNRKIEEMLRCYVNHHQSNWDEFLVDIEVAYNSSPHATTT